MFLLSLIWLVTSLTLGLLQLLVLTQPEWIVTGTTSMGLFALCSPTTCILRAGSAALPLLSLFIGGMMLFLSAASMIPALLCSRHARPIRIIANMQFVSVFLCAITVVLVPLDLSEVGCSLSELLRSSSCRVGWAYAVCSVSTLLSMCCPILGRLVAEGRGIDYALVPRKPSTPKQSDSQEFYL